MHLLHHLPVNEGHSELLARTSPTIYDVLIGFFGGAARILAIGSRVKGNVIPGVAIATALMPPLCTVGYGLATLQMHYFIGALYLFFINSVFIATATTLGVRLMNYSYKDFSNPARARRVRNAVYTVAILTMIPAVYLTYNMIVNNTYNNNCANFVNSEFQFPATQVLNYKITNPGGQRTLTVTLMGQMLPQDSLLTMMDGKLEAYHLNNTRLRIIQGNGPGPEDLATASSAMLRDMYTVTQATITRQQNTIDSLRQAQRHNNTPRHHSTRHRPRTSSRIPPGEHPRHMPHHQLRHKQRPHRHTKHSPRKLLSPHHPHPARPPLTLPARKTQPSPPHPPELTHTYREHPDTTNCSRPNTTD